jgi:hypothetical protein
VSLATAAEKTAIEKSYYPTISTKVVPEILSEMFRIVKAALGENRDNPDNTMDVAQPGQKSIAICYCL